MGETFPGGRKVGFDFGAIEECALAEALDSRQNECGRILRPPAQLGKIFYDLSPACLYQASQEPVNARIPYVSLIAVVAFLP